MKKKMNSAISDLENGGFLMIYDGDGREKEVDLVTPSIKITPDKIERLRRDAGGLICVTVPPETWKKLDLPYLQDILELSKGDFPLLDKVKADDIPYDEKSTFSLSINHRDTFTGITDRDRALTISRFAELSSELEDLDEEEAMKSFGEEFRSPGHVFLLNASEGLLSERSGHTELTTAILKSSELFPSMTICEMLSSDGGSLSKEEAKVYGEKNDISLLEGKAIKDSRVGLDDG